MDPENRRNPISNYWNVIFGMNPGEVLKDEEGMQIMRILGKNMAWTLKLIENGKDKIIKPEREAKIYTNFIRDNFLISFLKKIQCIN
ncbi:hypothetical protein V4D30_03000 [Thermodesulfovibrio sp. 3907-1M]|uniref:Uncharacterized protein n=1 Tax=Thermodesulfovibrio autotrophicus TaxID=3118333 RepID=A0AAU8GXH8_9BACT